MGIRDKPIAPRSPWQNGFAERLIGSIRRECLDHVIVYGEAHLRQILCAYAGYYNGRELTDRWTKTRPSIAQLSALASCGHVLFLADFITSTFGSSFQYTRSGSFSRCRSSKDCTTITSGSN